MCIQSLRDEGYDVTGYFANPNIHPVSEYFRRREAMEQVAEQMDLPMLWQDDVYDLPGWLKLLPNVCWWTASVLAALAVASYFQLGLRFIAQHEATNTPH